MNGISEKIFIFAPAIFKGKRLTLYSKLMNLDNSSPRNKGYGIRSATFFPLCCIRQTRGVGRSIQPNPGSRGPINWLIALDCAFLKRFVQWIVK